MEPLGSSTNAGATTMNDTAESIPSDTPISSPTTTPTSTSSIDGPSTFTHLVQSRHTTRFFFDQPVPTNLLHESALLAQNAPSNSNIQPWRLHLATGPRRDRIITALSTAASTTGPSIPPLPPAFAHHRDNFVDVLYGPSGYDIPRSDTRRVQEARMRNFRFFDAPVVGIVTLDAALGHVDVMTVGMFVQVFLLALAERGLGSCLMVSVVGFEGVLREGFGVGEEQRVLCGIGVGYEDLSKGVAERVNGVGRGLGREKLGEAVVLLEE